MSEQAATVEWRAAKEEAEAAEKALHLLESSIHTAAQAHGSPDKSKRKQPSVTTPERRQLRSAVVPYSWPDFGSLIARPQPCNAMVTQTRDKSEPRG